jgi:two-component system, NarL family, invasion response regulator UvrY
MAIHRIMTHIKIAIVDDHALVRSGLRGFFTDQPDIEVVAEACDGAQALDMVRQHPLDVLILDISMPKQSGMDVLARIQAHAPDLGILILSGYPEEHYAVSLLRRGVSGYLNKQCEPEDILAAVRRIAGGSRYITPEVAEMLAGQLNRIDNAPAHEQLSARELQVLLRLAKGETVGDIAHSLCLSAKTVSTYRTRILEKMGLTSNSDLTYYALKNGLLD